MQPWRSSPSMCLAVTSPFAYTSELTLLCLMGEHPSSAGRGLQSRSARLQVGVLGMRVMP